MPRPGQRGHAARAGAMTDAAGAPPAAPRRRAVPALLATGAAVAAALGALPFSRPLPLALGFALYAAIAALVLDRLGPHHPYARFGLGNAVTLARGGGAAVFAALAAEPRILAGPAAWRPLAGAALLLALDGVDGRAARGQGLASAFGARFDMEVDALLILALAAIAVGLGKAGPWVLALGLIRYAFVLAGWIVPRLAHPLPPSQRRRAVCALQVAVLGLLLTPPLVPPWSGRPAALALLALVWSFAIDLRWLARQR
jgi:phosphatidylglycerophosphate synthase